MRTIVRAACIAAFCAALSFTPALAQSPTPPPTISAVLLNQTGFQPIAPKRAVVVTDAAQPITWILRDARGRDVARGQTIVFGMNAASGQNVHQVDFSSYTGNGEGYTLSAGGVASHPFDISQRIYRPLKYDGLAFFYHQRVSVPIEARFVGERWARPIAHAPDRATCYGPNDYRGNVWGGCPYTLDVSRGWYDAGDQGKYIVNGGISVWTLMNYYEHATDALRQPVGARAFADGRLRIPEAGNGVNDLLDEIRFELDFFLAMQVPDGTRLRLPLGDQHRTLSALVLTEVDASGMAHHKIGDEHWTAVPTPPHLDRETRYLAPPSTAATLNLAAVTAQCARIWREIDAAFSARCLTAARKAYDAAQRVPNAFAIQVLEGGSGGYGDGQLSDEFYWAATELFLTTGEARYGDAMRASPHFASAGDFAWPRVDTPATISLALLGNGEDQARARAAIIALADAYRAETQREGYAIPFARPYVWGSNADFANRGMVLAYAYEFTGERFYRDEVVNAMDYILGRNPMDFSYVAGYGERALENPHHRFWGHSRDASLPPPPPGTLSGGPNAHPVDDLAPSLAGCRPQRCYADDIRAYSLNEVAINWNAPFFWVAAFLDE